MTARSTAAIKLILAMAVGALVIVLAKRTLNNLSFVSFLWLQMSVAIVAMLIYTFAFKKEKLPSQVNIKEWALVIAIGLLNFVIVRFIFIYALDLIPVTTHAYVMNFVGIITMLLSSVLLKEKPFGLQIIGALIAILGIWVYFYESPPANEVNGVLWLSFAVFCLALTNICMRLLHLLKDNKLSSNQVTTMSILVGGIPILIYGIATDLPLPSIDWFDWLIIIANGLLAVALPIVVFIQVLEHLRAYEASILATCGVIFTALFAIPILGDYLTSFEVLGMLLMLIGLYFVQKQKKLN